MVTSAKKKRLKKPSNLNSRISKNLLKGVVAKNKKGSLSGGLDSSLDTHFEKTLSHDLDLIFQRRIEQEL